MNRIRRIFLFFLAVMVLFCVSSTVFAQREEKQNLTIIYKDQKTPIVNCEFEIYYVASLTKGNHYIPTENFEKYNLVWDEDTIQRLAYTLEGYVVRDGIQPIQVGTTNQWGSLVFSSLPAGIYLVLTNRHIQNEHAYETRPFIASLVGAPEQVQVFPKSESKPPQSSEETACKILKIWDDEGYEQYRPKEIQVDLLENGKLYDTVVLNEDNNWRHTWTELNPASRFVVVEKECGNYIPIVAYQGITYTITNKYYEEEEESTPSSEPTSSQSTSSEPPPSEPSYSSTPESDPDSSQGTPPPEKLPQTGQLWWPIPILLAIGLVFVVLGLLARRGVL